MNKPTPETAKLIKEMAAMPRLEPFFAWLVDNQDIAGTNLKSFEGAEMHRTQGDARTLDDILAQTDGAYGTRQGSERAGRVRTR